MSSGLSIQGSTSLPVVTQQTPALIPKATTKTRSYASGIFLLLAAVLVTAGGIATLCLLSWIRDAVKSDCFLYIGAFSAFGGLLSIPLAIVNLENTHKGD